MWFLIVTLFPNAGPLGVLTGHIVALLLYAALFFRLRIPLSDHLKSLIILGIVFCSSIFLSLLVNIICSETNISMIRYGFVPIYWLFGLIAGIIDYKIFGRGRDGAFFYRIAIVFICVQLPLVILQMVGLDQLLSIFWSTEKVKDWSSLTRVVGTLGNPNALGIFSVASIIIFIQNLQRKTIWPKLFIVISIFIIALTGSRTSLILLLLVPLFQIAKVQLFSKKTLYIILGFILFSLAGYFLLILFKEKLPYLSQILNIVSGKEISSIENRFNLWEEAWSIYDSNSIFQFLFGLGPGYFSVADNAYLYILINYGIVSISIFVALIILLYMTIKQKKTVIPKQYLFLLLISGLVADSLISFSYMTFLFYMIGFNSRMVKQFRHKTIKVT